MNLLVKQNPEPTYTVTYNGNANTAGTVPSDGASYSSGSTVTVLENSGGLSKTDYFFAGWNTKADGSGTTYAGGASFAIPAASITLFARWLPSNPLSVTIDIAPGDSITVSATLSIAKGTALEIGVSQAFSEYAWYLDLQSLDRATQSISLDTSSMTPGLHELVVIVVGTSGQRSSGRCRFNVVN